MTSPRSSAISAAIDFAKLVLGGAALQRCDKRSAIIVDFSPEVLIKGWNLPQTSRAQTKKATPPERVAFSNATYCAGLVGAVVGVAVAGALAVTSGADT